jgi:hypothetical protein
MGSRVYLTGVHDKRYSHSFATVGAISKGRGEEHLLYGTKPNRWPGEIRLCVTTEAGKMPLAIRPGKVARAIPEAKQRDIENPSAEDCMMVIREFKKYEDSEREDIHLIISVQQTKRMFFAMAEQGFLLGDSPFGQVHGDCKACWDPPHLLKHCILLQLNSTVLSVEEQNRVLSEHQLAINAVAWICDYWKKVKGDSIWKSPANIFIDLDIIKWCEEGDGGKSTVEERTRGALLLNAALGDLFRLSVGKSNDWESTPNMMRVLSNHASVESFIKAADERTILRGGTPSYDTPFIDRCSSSKAAKKGHSAK